MQKLNLESMSLNGTCHSIVLKILSFSQEGICFLSPTWNPAASPCLSCVCVSGKCFNCDSCLFTHSIEMYLNWNAITPRERCVESDSSEYTTDVGVGDNTSCNKEKGREREWEGPRVSFFSLPLWDVLFSLFHHLIHRNKDCRFLIIHPVLLLSLLLLVQSLIMPLSALQACH